MRFAPILSLLLLLLSGASARAAQKRYAVVVGNATSLTEGVRPLEFADDDAARYAELLDVVAEDVRLLTVLDENAQRIHPALVERALPPNRRNLLRTLEELFAVMAREEAAGNEAVFYFILIGHGEIAPGGEGYVSILDAPFSRSDLYEQVIARSPASTNHVIIDACNSYFLVNRRGADDAGPSRADAVAGYLSREELASYPNTGVVLSTSSAKESHEWSAYRAGVFSHEVRSAMTGAADANGDGRVDYAELHAFVTAANLRVDDPRARIELYVRPPAVDLTTPLIDLRSARFTNYLSIPPGKPARFYLEDDRGVRYADVHLSGETHTYLALVRRDFYWVRDPEDRREGRFELSGPGRVELDQVAMSVQAMTSRGAIGDAFQRHLFTEPYGPGFFRGFAAANGYAPQARGSDWTPLQVTTDRSTTGRTVGAISLFVAGAGLVGASIFAQVQSDRRVAEFEESLGAEGAVVGLTRAEAESLEADARTWAWWRTGLAVGAGAAVAGGLLLLLWPDESPDVAVSSDGRAVYVGGRFP